MTLVLPPPPHKCLLDLIPILWLNSLQLHTAMDDELEMAQAELEHRDRELGSVRFELRSEVDAVRNEASQLKVELNIRKREEKIRSKEWKKDQARLLQSLEKVRVYMYLYMG